MACSFPEACGRPFPGRERCLGSVEGCAANGLSGGNSRSVQGYTAWCMLGVVARWGCDSRVWGTKRRGRVVQRVRRGMLGLRLQLPQSREYWRDSANGGEYYDAEQAAMRSKSEGHSARMSRVAWGRPSICIAPTLFCPAQTAIYPRPRYQSCQSRSHLNTRECSSRLSLLAYPGSTRAKICVVICSSWMEVQVGRLHTASPSFNPAVTRPNTRPLAYVDMCCPACTTKLHLRRRRPANSTEPTYILHFHTSLSQTLIFPNNRSLYTDNMDGRICVATCSSRYAMFPPLHACTC